MYHSSSYEGEDIAEDVNEVIKEFDAVQEDRHKLSKFIDKLHKARDRMVTEYEAVVDDRQEAEDRLKSSPIGSNLIESNPVLNSNRLHEMSNALDALSEVESAAIERETQMTMTDFT